MFETIFIILSVFAATYAMDKTDDIPAKWIIFMGWLFAVIFLANSQDFQKNRLIAIDDDIDLYKCTSIRFSKEVPTIYVKINKGQFAYGTTPEASFEARSILRDDDTIIVAQYYFKTTSDKQRWTFFKSSNKLILEELGDRERVIFQQEFMCG